MGSSGSGNHFVEFGIVTLEDGNGFQLPPGNYTALLSHSGSRSLGANIAQHYTNVAMNKCKLPAEAKHLAWLDLSTEEGQAYWLSMNLAGEYAKACHDVIHDTLRKACGLSVAEQGGESSQLCLAGGDRRCGVHCPSQGCNTSGEWCFWNYSGSMTAPGYIVRGLGNEGSSIFSGAWCGRKMSRQKAKDSLTMSSLKKILQQERVTLIGGSTEEAPSAYKDIELIMRSQSTLVNIEGKISSENCTDGKRLKSMKQSYFTQRTD